MKNYVKPEVKKHLSTLIAYNQYEIPNCSTDFSGQCTVNGNTGGGPTGATCADPTTINVTAFVVGAIDTSSFPCELLINGAPVGVSFFGPPTVANCSGQDGIAYFLQANVGSCPGAVSSVAVSCDSGTSTCPLITPQ